MPHEAGWKFAFFLDPLNKDIRRVDVLAESINRPLLLLFNRFGVKSLAKRIEDVNVDSLFIEVRS